MKMGHVIKPRNPLPIEHHSDEELIKYYIALEGKKEMEKTQGKVFQEIVKRLSISSENNSMEKYIVGFQSGLQRKRTQITLEAQTLSEATPLSLRYAVAQKLKAPNSQNNIEEQKKFNLLNKALTQRYRENHEKMLAAAQKQMRHLIKKYENEQYDYEHDSGSPNEKAGSTPRIDEVSRLLLLGAYQFVGSLPTGTMFDLGEQINAVSTEIAKLTPEKGRKYKVTQDTSHWLKQLFNEYENEYTKIPENDKDTIKKKLLNGERIKKKNFSKEINILLDKINERSDAIAKAKLDPRKNLAYYRDGVIAAHTYLTAEQTRKGGKKYTNLEIIKKDLSPVTRFFEKVFHAVSTALIIGAGFTIARAVVSKQKSGTYEFWKTKGDRLVGGSVKETEKDLGITPKKHRR